MIDTGMGPVFAFCDAWMNSTFIEFSIEAGMPRRRGLTTLLRSEVVFLEGWKCF
jgi:hypothetical protein